MQSGLWWLLSLRSLVVEYSGVVVKKRPEYGKFINSNSIETYDMAAYTEFLTTMACEILLYLLITFCAYVAKTQSLSGTTMSEISTTSSYITLIENTLTLNNMWCELWQGPATSHSGMIRWDSTSPKPSISLCLFAAEEHFHSANRSLVSWWQKHKHTRGIQDKDKDNLIRLDRIVSRSLGKLQVRSLLRKGALYGGLVANLERRLESRTDKSRQDNPVSYWCRRLGWWRPISTFCRTEMRLWWGCGVTPGV